MKSNFGRALHTEIKLIGKNQTWLAERSGITQGALNRILNGEVRPDVETMRSLCSCWPDLGTNIRILIEHLHDEVARAGVEKGIVAIDPSDVPDLTELNQLLSTMRHEDPVAFTHLVNLVRALTAAKQHPRILLAAEPKTRYDAKSFKGEKQMKFFNRAPLTTSRPMSPHP